MISPSTIYLVLQLLEPDAAPPRAGQVVGTSAVELVGRPLAVACGLLAVERRLLTVASRLGTIADCADPGCPGTRAQVVDAQGVPVGQVLLAVEVGSLGVLSLSTLVAQRGALVTLARNDISLPSGAVA
ncbi:MAG TPA: hypothetical protein VK304_04050 [Thermoleophilaceae bacterium]|nr:hypothetical protein [Thermoleophilaceae bacterium]